jgi:uncharacterized protein YecE (DUF72 family)
VNQTRVGIAGWSNPPAHRGKRPDAQSHLEYYARYFGCVEINSSFYRSHRQETYQRWRDATPARFRFAVKMPRSITHECGLRNARRELSGFFAEIEGLGTKLEVILIQLPPSLEFTASTVRTFFRRLPRLPDIHLVCEPRHVSWFSKSADALLLRAGVSRAAVDPAIIDAATVPGGDRRFAYYRWHGSPRMYYSSYRAAQLTSLAATLCAAEPRAAWCIFDNTARYAAWRNAATLESSLRRMRRAARPRGKRTAGE